MMKEIQVVNSMGVKFTVRRVNEGDSYGLDAVHNDKDPLIEFYAYDSSMNNKESRGQMVSRYYMSTLKDAKFGLNLNGEIEEWYVTGENMNEIIDKLFY